MAINGRHIIANTIEPRAFSKDYWRYTFDQFGAQPGAWPTATTPGYGTPAGTIGAINAFANDGTGSNSAIYEYNLWSAQTIVAPVYSNGLGLDMALDLVNAHGVEYVPGGNDASYGKHKAVIGPGSQLLSGTPPLPTPADPNNNMIFRMNLALSTVANSIQCSVGFRKVQTYQHTSLATYTDFAAINLNAGTVNIQTQTASGGLVTTVSTETVANSVYCTLEARIFNTKVFFYFNSKPVAVQPVPAYAFTAGLTVVPFFLFLQAAGANTHAYVTSIEIGPEQTMILDQRGAINPGSSAGGAF